jgi:hypothetical protein
VPSAPLESKPPEAKAFAPVQEQQRTLADSPDARAAAAAAQAQTGQQESRAASTARETPQARVEGKVIPFPARREDEPGAAPEAAPPASEEPPASVAPNTPRMPHVLASQQAAKQATEAEAERGRQPAEPTVREPALERKREREERVGAQTLHLGSGVAPETPAPSGPSAAPAAPASSSMSSTQRLSSGGTQPLDVSALSAPAAAAQPDKPAAAKARGEAVHEALHDDFFDAGDQGTYEGGHGADTGPGLLDDELEQEAPRVIVRTPAQEQRRARLMQVVGVVVGVVLGVFVFAVLRGRGSAPAEPKPGDVPAGEQPAAVEPPPAPPPAPAPQPPAAAEVTPPPPAEPEIAVPEPAPAEPKPAAAAPAPAAPKPVAPKPVEAAPRPRPEAPAPAPKPAAQPRPAGPLPPPIPAGKPPTVSFPD